MATNVSWPPIGGTTYSIPAAGELNWQALSNFLIAIGNNAQGTQNTKLAIRVATTTPVTVASSTDCVIVTDLAVAGAVAVNLPAGVTGQCFFIVDGKGDAASNNITIDGNGGETINGSATYVINKNRAGILIGWNGTSWTVLAEYFSIASGTIPRSAIAAGSPDHVVINDGSGNLSSEAQLAKSRGGTGADNSSVTFPASGTIPTLTGTGQFTNKDYDGGTASNTLRVTLPKNTTTNLDALTRKEATLVYDTDTSQVKYDDGSVLVALASTATATPDAEGTVTSYSPIIKDGAVTITNSDYTILEGDGYNVIYVSTGNTNRVITLPTNADSAGRVLIIRKSDTGTGYAEVQTPSAGVVIRLHKVDSSAVFMGDGSASMTIGAISGDVSAEGDLGALTWDGTPPSGTIAAKYYWRKQGGTVHLWTRTTATVAGATNTTLSFALPTDCPTPVSFANWGNSEVGYVGVGLLGASEGTTATGSYSNIAKDGGGGFTVLIRAPSTNAVAAWSHIAYATTMAA